MTSDYVIVYTIHCPACNVLEKKLQKAGINYSVIDDVEKMTSIEQFPMMQVNCGPLMTLKEANQWIKEKTNG
jgi:glutaredoxin-related protein